MAVFINKIPTKEEALKEAQDKFPYIEPEAWYSHLLLRKLTAEFDINLEKLFSQYDLSIGRFTVMFLLYGNPKGLTPSELAQMMNVTQATTTGLLKNLEKQDIVERMSHQKDGRSFLIRISEKGRKLADTIFPVYHGRLNSFWDGFTEDQKQHTFNCIETLLGRVNNLGEKV